MAKKDDKKVEDQKAENQNVDANAAEVKTVEKDGVTSTLPTETLAERAKKVEVPKPTDARPLSDPNGGPKNTPDTYKEEAQQKADAFDKRETYLDINDPSHANKTFAQLQKDAGADVENMR
jgi:hypothetical protein